ncbi:P-loop containing nucleoside triphosphate hydrolase protein [Ostreococcus tauri]|uniref:Mg-protoporphyrin IX chelatase n=1 Tax=Ostreococcus tauri TaxID=70448 RepID=A0A1Y5IBB2_OSTTA|nr:P-loop containing nucleoside triphosphate hydrolase protein [Ostreococcus tauri]
MLARAPSSLPRARVRARARVVDPPTFPFTAICDHAAVKTALLLGCIDDSLSIICTGRRGSGKSILCKSVRDLMRSDAPFVSIPLGVTEDRVIGTVDVERSVRSGATVLQRGLLANAHGGALYVDEINLLDDALLAMIQSNIAAGIVRTEREGLSVTAPCQCLALASFNPEEAELRAHVVDRFAMICSTDDSAMDMKTRIEALDVAMLWQDDWRYVVREHEHEQSELRAHLEISRALLHEVTLPENQVRRMVKIAVEAGVQGHRGDIFAAKVARASAALRHSLIVNDGDVNVAVSLVILPRATRDPPEDALTPPPPQGARQAPADRGEDEEKDEAEDDTDDVDVGNSELEPQVQEPDESKLDVSSLIDSFERAMHRSFAEKKTRGTVSGRTKGENVFNITRGRYVKPMFPKSGQIRGKIAIDATLRAAAPYQIFRRERRAEHDSRRIFITKDDVRLKKLSRKSASLTVFVVDASGSMAMNRMAVAKAAVFRLLALSYTKRDLVALVQMSGDAAFVALPPTRSTIFVTRRLAVMPCGGGTPLAHGLTVAARVAVNSRRRGKSTVGSVRQVLLTDGRPTRSLTWSQGNSASRQRELGPGAPTRQNLRDECLEVARAVRRLGVKSLVVDTDSDFIGDRFCASLADALGGTYHAIPKLDAVALESLI